MASPLPSIANENSLFCNISCLALSPATYRKKYTQFGLRETVPAFRSSPTCATLPIALWIRTNNLRWVLLEIGNTFPCTQAPFIGWVRATIEPNSLQFSYWLQILHYLIILPSIGCLPLTLFLDYLSAPLVNSLARFIQRSRKFPPYLLHTDPAFVHAWYVRSSQILR